MIKYSIKYISEIIGWTPSFFLLKTVTQKDCLSCFIWVLNVSLRLTLIQKVGLCLQVTTHPLTTEFSLSFCIFFFYKNVVQKLKLSKIHTTVSRQQYCVLTAEIKIPYNNYKNQENKED